MNDDLKERLEKAATELDRMAYKARTEYAESPGEDVRLSGKAEGVRLALSYLREGYAVVALPESNRGWGVHPGFMVDESYVVGAAPGQVFLEDDDAVTALSPAKARAIAAALLAAASEAEK